MSNLDELVTRIAEGHDVVGDLDGNFSLDEVSQAIDQLLRANDDRYFHATTLLRDLVLSNDQAPESFGQRFRESYLAGERQAIVDRLEADVLRNNIQVRPWAIYTLGKIGAQSSLPSMKKSFETALQRIPDIVHCLASEIRWLEESLADRRSILERLVESDSYLHRWAAVDVIESGSDGDEELVTKLKTDEHPYVRRAASLVGKEGRSRGKFVWGVAAFRPTQSTGNYSLPKFEAFVDAYMATHEPRTHKELRKLGSG